MADRPTPNSLANYAINADDPERAQRFYSEVFGWTFTPRSSYDFQISGDSSGVFGVLQKRRQLVDGVTTVAFECSIAVSDLDETLRTVQIAGGEILMPPTRVPSVGVLAFVQDTEGNAVGIMQYD